MMCLSTLVVFGTRPAHAASMPPADWSYYVTKDDVTDGRTDAYTLGCDQGSFDESQSPYTNSLVVLDFGLQTSSGSGTILTFSGNTVISNSDIAYMVTEFAHGYFNCTGVDATSVLDLAVGTNDSANYSTSTYTALGKDWGNLGETIKSDISGYAAQVSLYMANDIEDWYGPGGFYVPSSDANAWASGFSSVTNPGFLDYGDADGCSTTSYNNTACSYGYHQQDYYNYSWGYGPALPLPEIYYSGSAWQWTRISQYAYYYQSQPMTFYAPMDDYDLQSGTLTSSQAYADLTGDLSSVGMHSSVAYDTEIHCWVSTSS